MKTKLKRVAKQEENGKGCFAATKNIGRSKKGQQELMDQIEKETVESYNN